MTSSSTINIKKTTTSTTTTKPVTTVIETVEFPSSSSLVVLANKPTITTSTAQAPAKMNKDATLTNVFDSTTSSDDQRKVAAGCIQELFQKRLRALKKRITKIEKYECEPVEKLNKDQQEAIAKKPELIFAVKELEDMIKPVSVLEAEEETKMLKFKQDLETEKQSQIEVARKGEQAKQEKKSADFFELLFALNYLFPSRLAPTVSSQDKEQFSALAFFRAVVSGEGLEMVENVQVFSTNATACLNKFFAQDEEEFVNSVSYKDLYALVQKILNPPPLPTFVAQEVVDETIIVPSFTVIVGEDQRTDQHLVAVDAVVIPPVDDHHASFVVMEAPPVHVELPSLANISFINPSEVLGQTEQSIEPNVTVIHQMNEQIQNWSEVPVESEYLPIEVEPLSSSLQPAGVDVVADQPDLTDVVEGTANNAPAQEGKKPKKFFYRRRFYNKDNKDKKPVSDNREIVHQDGEGEAIEKNQRKGGYKSRYRPKTHFYNKNGGEQNEGQHTKPDYQGQQHQHYPNNHMNKPREGGQHQYRRGGRGGFRTQNTRPTSNITLNTKNNTPNNINTSPSS